MASRNWNPEASGAVAQLLQLDGESQGFWEVPRVFIAATFASPAFPRHSRLELRNDGPRRLD